MNSRLATEIRRCQFYYRYGSPNTNYTVTNINQVNYVLNHRLGNPNFAAYKNSAQDAIWYVLYGRYIYDDGLNLDFTNRVARAILFGRNFQPGPGQISIIVEDNDTNQPVGIEIRTGTNGAVTSFWLT